MINVVPSLRVFGLSRVRTLIGVFGLVLVKIPQFLSDALDRLEVVVKSTNVIMFYRL